jgi:hypothetical protein
MKHDSDKTTCWRKTFTRFFMKPLKNRPRPYRLFNRAFLTSAALGLLSVITPRLAADPGIASSIADYFDHWHDRVAAAQASQPDWITPLATTTPRLEEEFRYDQNRQTLKNGTTVDVYDGGKGLELIPTEQTEVIVALPAYQVRRGTSPASGLNDWPGILLKYRLFSAPKQSGDYIVTLFAQYGLPTGALVYTNRNHVFTPTLAVGKGIGDFDLQATVGEAIPTHDNSNSGRALLTNLTAQCHILKLLWPEVELNRTDWTDGSRNARSQTYLTPGIVVGRFLLGGHSKFIAGLGYQTAISTRYAAGPATPTFNHNWILSVRTTF